MFHCVLLASRILDSSIGAHGAYFVYAAFALAAAAVTVAFLPETRGRSLKEIEEYFAPPQSARSDGEE